ncbi:protein kinase [Caldibacillus lycopersici]|uniref:Protein kinase n=1 Tax=Perspicuibacillus lycopersici TaxID=1325689 RepID=A0AAE3IU23_9BACI|nr:protein kinase [Perspicuibacillus lycopersici]MCU9614630.1 protein kinase [Perspicuibacillus lycopersici]
MRFVRKIIQFIVDTPIEKDKILMGRYQVKAVLGIGSYGMVYECIDLLNDTRVAVKQLRPSKRKKQLEIDRFTEEIHMLRLLGNHSSIPKLLESFQEEGHWFYVMEFIDGENLESLLFDKKLVFTRQEALLLIRQLVSIVDYLHNHSIYHGDLRIPNILMKNDVPVLIDFGLACRLIDSRKNNDKEKSKQREILTQDDYYDLGDILLFLLYSTYPKKNRKALSWIEELSLPATTTNLLRRLLGIDERYANVEEIFHDLDKAILEGNVHDTHEQILL